jgi:uncharacterized protein (DUF111 family)
MKREIKQVKTRYGKVRFKQSVFGDITRVTPEYEDCKKAAKEHNVALYAVIEETQRAAEMYATHIKKRSSS